MRFDLSTELPLELSALQKLFSAVAGTALIHPLMYRPLACLTLGTPARELIDKARKMKMLLRMAFAREIPSEFVWRDKAFTRVSTGMKSVLEDAYGKSPQRYYKMYKTWLRSQQSSNG